MRKTPLHIFVIPDGSRRWEQASVGRGLRSHGHRAGYEVFKHLAQHVWDLGVTDFTFWAISIDNFHKRPKAEIDFLVELLRLGITELREILEKGEKKIRVQIVGDTGFRIPWQILREMDRLEQDTKCHQDGTLNLLVAYDGKWDLATAFERIRNCGQKSAVTPYELLRSLVPSANVPDVDLMVRTGGEPHLSGAALPLQMADAALYFTETFWPDFTMQNLAIIVTDFKKRRRRLGA